MKESIVTWIDFHQFVCVMNRSIPAVTILPRADPWGFEFFFRSTTNSPPQGGQKLQIPRPQATEKQQT